MQKQGYKESTYKSRTTWIKTLVKLRARIYINLEAALFKPVNDEFTVRVANNLEEACELLEAGFEYVTDMDGCKIFRKRK